MSLTLRLAEFNAAYAQAIDNDRLEQWPEFFCADAHYRVTTDENFREGLPAGAMLADSRAMLVDRISALRRANIYERQRYRHVLGLPVVLDAGATTGVPATGVTSIGGAGTGAETTTVRAETSFVVVRIVAQSESMLFASGAYHDLFELGPYGVLLRSRIVVCDSSSFDTLLAIPL